jgi:hypothetical protein
MEALPNPPNVSTPPTMTKIFSSLPTTNSNKLAFQEKKAFQPQKWFLKVRSHWPRFSWAINFISLCCEFENAP